MHIVNSSFGTIPASAPEAIIFDMDGTLFRTETLLLPSYRRMFERLREEGLHKGGTPSPDIILGALGMLLKDIWARVMPEASESARARADELLLEEQLNGMKLGTGELYPGVKETLAQLHAWGFRLFVASNGLEGYVKGVAEAYGISQWFEGLYSAGEYETASKVELVRLLLARHNVQTAWMVGDRSSDVEAGKMNGLSVVGCRYAEFGVSEGELDGSDMIIHSFPELLSLLQSAKTAEA